MHKLQWASLRLPQGNGRAGMCRYGSSGNSFNWGCAGFTLPAMRAVSSADRLHGTLPLQKSACSEMLRNASPFVSGCSAAPQPPNKPVYEDNLDDVFLPDASHVTALRAEHQKASWENRTIRRSPSQHRDALWVTPTVPLMGQDIRQETARRQPSVAKRQEATADTLK